MANKKFSEFVLKTSTSDVSHIVGYNGAENVQITPANFLDTTGGPYLPLAGGTMTGTNGVVFPDNFYLNLGTSSDFEIYHDGNNSYLKDQGTGELILASNGTGIKLEKTSGEKMIHALTDGAVELYFDSVKKLETTNTGISVTGNGVFSGQVKIDSNAAYKLNVEDTNSFLFYGATDASIGSVFRLRSNNKSSTIFDIDAVGNITQSSGVLNIPIGSAASPSLIFAGDDDTGLFHPTSNTIAFSTFGVERMRLDASGNLGIGSANANAYGKFLVDGTGNLINANASSGAATFQLYEAGAGRFGIVTLDGTAGAKFTTAGVEKMRLDSSGNLGLGVSNPDVFTSVSAQNLVLGNTSSSNGLTVLSGTSAYGNLAFADGTGAGSQYRGLIQYGHTLNSMQFFTESLERMRIDSAGNVGIGTSTPSEKIDIVANDSTMAKFSSIGGLANDKTLLIQSGGDRIIYDARTESTGGVASHSFVSAGTEKMRITSGGEVRVKTSSIVVETAGEGIYLGGTAAANKLDDYEEGDWTPTIAGTWTTDPTNITGKYTKIGNLVSIVMQWTGGAKTSSTSGYFESLPFSVSNPGTGSVSDSGVADRGNCLFANTQVVWLTSTTFGGGSNYLSGTYITTD